MNRQGIDVSMFQGNVDWEAASHTIAFAFCKASQGTSWVDPYWNVARVIEIRRAGIPFGGYHFADNSGTDGAAEARHFVTALRGAGWNPKEAGEFWDRFHQRGKFRNGPGGWEAVRGCSMPGVLDIESGTGGHPGRRFVRRFVREYVLLTGHRPCIYTGNFWRALLANPILHIRCRLWLAAYTPSPVGWIPREWSKPTFWQYTDAFHCPGVSSPCDGDKFMGHFPRKRRKR